MAKTFGWRRVVAGATGSLALVAATLAATIWPRQPAVAANAIPAIGVSAGREHTVVLRSDSSAWAFGESADGRLGRVPVGTVTPSPTPMVVPGLSGLTAVAAGSRHTLTLRSDGTVWAFGSNSFGVLGNLITAPDVGYNPTPTQVPGLTSVTAIAAGAAHSVVLRSDGTVWTFGENNLGQLGLSTNSGTQLANPTPTQVPGLTNATAIAAGAAHSVVLRSDGTVWTFGENNAGQLGSPTNYGNPNPNPTPTQVPGLTNVTAIAAGGDETLALRNDGTVWAFGDNLYGQLGRDTGGASSSVATQVPGLTNVTAIAAGGVHSLVLLTDTTVWAFGHNAFGQLGTTTNNRSGAQNPTPTQIPGLTGVAAIAASGDPSGLSGQSVVVHIDGTVLTFGSNFFGQLGTANGVRSTAPNPTPNRVVGLNKPLAGGVVKVHVSNTPNATVFGNLTVDQPDGGGYTTAYPCADGRPDSSNSNYVPGQTIPNFAAVRSDAAGDVCFYTTASAHLIWDQVAATTAITATNAARLLDTRGGAKPGAGAVVRVHVSNTPNATVFGNLTVDQPDGGGYTTAYPCADGRPDSSNSNYVPGQTIPNFAAVRSDAAGDVCFYTTASAHLIWDQVAATTAITATNAVRLLDTRSGGGKPDASEVIRVHVSNTPNATVFGNFTVDQPDGGGYTTAYPCADGRPDSSNGNYVTGQTIPNFAAVRSDAAGDVCFFTTASAHLIWDQVAVTTAITATNAVRLLDTRG